MIDNWQDWHKFWSLRLTILWMLLSGLWVALPSFSAMIPPVPFALICMGFSLAIGVARLTKQPGVS